MKLKHLMLAIVMAGVLNVPALADDREPRVQAEPLLDPRALLGGLVTDEDVRLLFAQIRATMLAAAEGREPPPVPEALNQRLETVGGELRLRALLAGIAMSQIMEQAARDAVRELALPPAPRNAL